MPKSTVGYELFKTILGTGIKNNLFVVKFPNSHKVTRNIAKSKTAYSASLATAGDRSNVSKIITAIKKANDFISDASLIGGNIFSLCKATSYPSEGYDVVTNSYWTRKTAGKINVPPISFSFIIDGGYKIYNLMNFFKDGVILDKEHGIYGYPEDYIFEKITIATFNPAVFHTMGFLGGVSKSATAFISADTPIYVKNFYNCWVREVGEVTKDASSKDTLEEFNISLEYEHSDDGNVVDLVDTGITKGIYLGKNIAGIVS